MTWSVHEHRDGDRGIQLDLAGDLLGVAVEPLRLMVEHTITDDQPDELSLTLDAVSAMDSAGRRALMAGYVTAIEHGIRYRVVDARGVVRLAWTPAGSDKCWPTATTSDHCNWPCSDCPPPGRSPERPGRSFQRRTNAWLLIML